MDVRSHLFEFRILLLFLLFDFPDGCWALRDLISHRNEIRTAMDSPQCLSSVQIHRSQMEVSMSTDVSSSPDVSENQKGPTLSSCSSIESYCGFSNHRAVSSSHITRSLHSYLMFLLRSRIS